MSYYNWLSLACVPDGVCVWVVVAVMVGLSVSSTCYFLILLMGFMEFW